MVLLLLLLLLPACLAEQVCINLNNSIVNIAVSSTSITDKLPNRVTCLNNGLPCVFDCTISDLSLYNDAWFNDSSACLDAEVTTLNNNNTARVTQYRITLSPALHVTCGYYACLNETILKLMESLSNDQESMLKLFYIRDSCLHLFNTDYGVKKEFIRMEKNMIHEVMETSTSEFDSYELKNLGLNVMNISTNELNTDNARMKVEAAQLLPENKSSIPEIWLPVNALRRIPRKERVVGLASYMWHSQFQFHEENITSPVIRIELLRDKRLHHLSTSVVMIYRDMANDSQSDSHAHKCHYLDEYEDWCWKTDGCETSITNNDIICSCIHTTAFAVLLIRQPIASDHWEILSYISYIGCGLSAFFTALSLVVYVFGRSSRMDHSVSIHVSLSGALFMLNTTFLLTEWGATVKLDWVCVFVAAFMHYSLLCCFTWMAIEALHLYLLLIKVFNTNYKHYLVKLSLAGWGIPSVIVGVSLGVKQNQFYGVTEMTMIDSNQTNAICWIVDDSYFYAMNLVYFALIFTFNSGILVAVASSICKMKQLLRNNSKAGVGAKENSWMMPARFTESCKSSLTVLGLTCLMGTTWGLAFLGSGYINYVILYLFCILNSTQGFFIFLWICLSTKRQRKRDLEDRMTSTPMKTSGTKSD